MGSALSVAEYIAGFPPEVAERLQRIRAVIVAEVRGPSEVAAPEEKIRHGIAAVMLGGRYALHYAGWKNHLGLYPVASLDEPLETELAPFRTAKDTVVFLHTKPIPYDLISRGARTIPSGSVAAHSLPHEA